LIADNLGWFRPTKTTIETIAEESGHKVKHLKPEDLIDAPPEVKAQMLEAVRVRRNYLASKNKVQSTSEAAHPGREEEKLPKAPIDVSGPGQ